MASGEESESERRQRLSTENMEKLEDMAENHLDELLFAAEQGVEIEPSNYMSRQVASRTALCENEDKDVCIIKGTSFYPEKEKGAHYYAYSPFAGNYISIGGFFDLPTDFNNAGTRNAYISVGVGGIYHGIDIGICNEGEGWYPYYFYHDDNNKGTFRAYNMGDYSKIADSSAVCANFLIRPFSNEDGAYILFVIVFYDDENDEPVESLLSAIELNEGDFDVTDDSIYCRFFRFISLIPKENDAVDNREDGSYMLGAGFSELVLGDDTTNYSWGITTDTIENAWMVYPTKLRLTYYDDGETCDIDHWAE